MRRAWSVAAAVALAAAVGLADGQNRIDTVTPMAPALAAYGAHAVGVRTLQVVDRARIDALRAVEGGDTPRYDRRLTLEAWYPAVPRLGGGPGDPYEAVTRDPAVTVVLRGRAWRDAAPLRDRAPYPLVILSHGYPGNRYLMSHLGENLASKGYVVVAIEHAESTYDDLQGFAGTLYHRPYDQLFVLEEMDRMSRGAGESGFGGLVDASRTALIGYSMGGYGVVNVVGGGYSRASPAFRNAPPNRLLAPRTAGHPEYPATADPRIRAAVAIAPWGMPAGFWDADGLAGIRTPILFVSGSADTVSGYERGTRAMFDAAVNADRALLTYLHAGHNAGAPIPPPEESYAFSTTLNASPFTHYADPVWDSVRMNNVLAHFVTAHLDVHVKGDESRRAYLDLVPRGADALWAMDEAGRPGATHTYWRGFARGTAVGLMFERAGARATPD